MKPEPQVLPEKSAKLVCQDFRDMPVHQAKRVIREWLAS